LNYAELDLPVLESRVDWITCTAPHTSEGTELMFYGQVRQLHESNQGYEVKDWRFQQYQGFQSRHWRWGWGKDGAIVVVSGEAAQESAQRLAELAAHWSRVDYCVTVVDSTEELDPPEDYWRILLARGRRSKNDPKYRRFQELWGGATFYTGERSAAYFGRCYDKHEESDHDYPPGTWRYEVELKRHASELAQTRAKLGEVGPAYVSGFVANEYERRGLTVPWRRSPEVMRDPGVHHRDDAERKIQWLKSSCAPSVAFAKEALGIDAVLSALNLPHIRYEEASD